MKVEKRDGRIVDFDLNKISEAIVKASLTVYGKDNIDNYISLASKCSKEVLKRINKMNLEIIDVESIQDLVEKVLIDHKESDIAKEYILYRNNRKVCREIKSNLMMTMKDIMFKDSKDNNLKRENGNIDGDTSMGTMLRIGSEASKQFYKTEMIKPKIAEAHNSGDIHIHDLDFYGLTETCCQIDINKLFKNGFSTGHGFLREPSNIISAAALTCIAIQANQNDQHGGQSIPAFDYALAPYVAKSYIKNIINVLKIKYDISDDISNIISNKLNDLYNDRKSLLNIDDEIESIIKEAIPDV